jgi:uridine kinase
VVVVDGRSGSGKTQLARRLARMLRAGGLTGIQIARLDDWYPGWDGLSVGTARTETLLLREPAYPEWDWEAGRVRRWVRLDPARPLIVEGAGALTARTRSVADVAVWVDVGPGPLDGEGSPVSAMERKRRALLRDGEAYRPWWDMWAAQELRHISRHRPRALADLEVLD